MLITLIFTRHGYEMMHLSTHDKQSFYEHLGYSLSAPVSVETKVSRFFSEPQVLVVNQCCNDIDGEGKPYFDKINFNFGKYIFRLKRWIWMIW